ncbi:MAG: TSUP family transporter [Clostridia bacterium]|jgi:hypothetical protein|nr:TSUP family transporter [Clostridia bacterium]MDD4275400.1 TSUP family transporter [Clostridia bacterium]
MKKFLKALLNVIIGAVIGLVNGFLGGGGGMLVVPYLRYVQKLKAKSAHATAILVILPISLASSIVYIFSKQITVINAVTVSGGVFIGGIIGAFLLPKISDKWLSIIFSIIMIVAGVRMLF